MDGGVRVLPALPALALDLSGVELVELASLHLNLQFRLMVRVAAPGRVTRGAGLRDPYGTVMAK